MNANLAAIAAFTDSLPGVTRPEASTAELKVVDISGRFPLTGVMSSIARWDEDSRAHFNEDQSAAEFALAMHAARQGWTRDEIYTLLQKVVIRPADNPKRTRTATYYVPTITKAIALIAQEDEEPVRILEELKDLGMAETVSIPEEPGRKAPVAPPASPESMSYVRELTESMQKDIESHPFTDLGNMERLITRFGEYAWYVYKWGKWMVWDGQRWRLDDGAHIAFMARSTVRLIPREAEGIEDKDERKNIHKFAIRSESKTRLDAMVELARTHCVEPDNLNKDPWLFNVSNGVIDLRTGKLVPSRKEDLNMLLSPLVYDPEAHCPNFLAFLEKVLPDENLREHLQRFVGYSLTGLTGERKLRIDWGQLARNGKALALDTPIPTPTGWTVQGKLEIGSKVFDAKGRICEVVGLSEVWQDRPCYRVTFSDGETVIADGEHEWVAKKVLGEPERVTTEEIAGNVFKQRRNPATRCYQFSVQMAKPLELPNVPLPIDPYVLGAWIGDGDSSGSRMTCGTKDVEHFIKQIESAGYYTKARRAGSAWSVTISLTPEHASRWTDSFRQRLRALGVLNNKHIPEKYLRASPAQRLALLQGLMDTDGSTLRRQAQCEFTSTNEQIASGVLELIRSLGLRPTLNVGTATIYGRVIGPKYRVLFTTTEELTVFRLQRKISICRPRTRPLNRKIIACELVPSVPVRCIQVNSPSSTYLCSRAMIPTHNSTLYRTLLSLFGEYATTVRFDTFGVKMDGKIRNDLASLVGKRLVVAVESGNDFELDVNMVKSIAGGDQIRCRFLFHEDFTYYPQFKIWLATNNRPRIRDADNAIWDRVHLVEWTYRFSAEEEVKDYAEKALLPELPGILNWAVEGCLKWQRDGMVAPARVVMTTEQYRYEEYPLHEFLEDFAEQDPTYETPIRNLYDAYLLWCGVNNIRIPMTQNRFSRVLRQRFSFRTLAGHSIYKGLRLRQQS